MRLADVHCECGCGRLVVQPRMGGPRKRFFENACRARWSRKGKQEKVTPQPVETPRGVEERRRTLERIYGELEADVFARGSIIDGRMNPAVEALRKINLDLNRFPLVEDEQTEVVATLHAI